MDRNREFHGERLKSARQLRALTLTSLSEQTGISKQSLSLYENGTQPSFERVAQLAFVLKVPLEYFFRGDTCRTNTSTTYFRSLASTSKMSRASQSLKLEYVAKAYEALSNYLDFPLSNIPEIEYSGKYNIYNENDTKEMIRELEEIASVVRKKWGLGENPINDVQLILESNGIIVTGFDTTEEIIDAFSQRIAVEGDNEKCIIAVDQGRKPRGRIRLDMCHELAHLLIHPWSESLEDISHEEFKTREYEANCFAGAFLLPRDSFGRDVSAYPTNLNYYQRLKKKWGVSIQAMAYRSHQIGIISTNQFQYMMRQVSKNGWRQSEPGDKPYFLGDNIFQSAIEILLDEKILNKQEIISLFEDYDINLYYSEIESILHLRPGTLAPDKEKQSVIIQLKSHDENNRSDY